MPQQLLTPNLRVEDVNATVDYDSEEFSITDPNGYILTFAQFA